MIRGSRVLVLTGLVAFTGCEPQSPDPAPAPPAGKVTSDDVLKDAGKALDTAKAFAQQAKEEIQKKLDKRLRDMDQEIEKLREKGADLKDDAKVEWDQKIADLESKRATAQAKLEELANSSGEAKKDLQEGAKSALDEIQKALEEASEKL